MNEPYRHSTEDTCPNNENRHEESVEEESEEVCDYPGTGELLITLLDEMKKKED